LVKPAVSSLLAELGLRASLYVIAIGWSSRSCWPRLAIPLGMELELHVPPIAVFPEPGMFRSALNAIWPSWQERQASDTPSSEADTLASIVELWLESYML
jgi:hypothetical protein